MPQEIYNEGRVVGYSAYEIFVKHHLAINPDTEPATETEWLAASIGAGNTILIQLNEDTLKQEIDTADETWDPDTGTGSPAGTHIQVHEVEIPATHKLCAASVIFGSIFLGNATFGADHFATKVTNWGYSIDEDNLKDNDPPVETSRLQGSMTNRIKWYSTIMDGGVVLDQEYKVVDGVKQLVPNVAGKARIRIFLRSPLTSDLPIVLTGFHDKSILADLVGMSGSSTGTSPETGDFLGPAVYPLVAKIIFSLPPAYVNQYMINNLVFLGGSENLPDFETAHPSYGRYGEEYKTVTHSPVIDMESDNMSKFYTEYNKNILRRSIGEPSIVDEAHYPQDGLAVISVYSYNKTKFAPALWGMKVEGVGHHYDTLYPLDVVAPGTVKMFEMGENTPTRNQKELQRAADFEETVTDNYAIIRWPDGRMETFAADGTRVPVVSVDGEIAGTEGNRVPLGTVKVGKTDTLKTIALNKKTSSGSWADVALPNPKTFSSSIYSGTNYGKDNSSNVTSINSDQTLTWKTLLDVLASEGHLDVLGNVLRLFRHDLPNLDLEKLAKAYGISNPSGVLNVPGTGTSTIGGDLEIGTDKSMTSSSLPYVTFGNGANAIRLYVSKTAPSVSGVPEGSIGIGWGG